MGLVREGWGGVWWGGIGGVGGGGGYTVGCPPQPRLDVVHSRSLLTRSFGRDLKAIGDRRHTSVEPEMFTRGPSGLFEKISTLLVNRNVGLHSVDDAWMDQVAVEKILPGLNLHLVAVAATVTVAIVVRAVYRRWSPSGWWSQCPEHSLV